MKRTCWILCIAFLALQCSVKEDDKNVELTRAMFESFNQHDWQKMASFYSENAMYLDPSYGKDYVAKTHEEITAKYEELEKMLPDIHDEIVGIYPSGDKVTVEFESTGTITDTLKFKLPIITVLTFKDDLIVKDATYYDQENP